MLAGYDHLIAAARRLQWDAEAIELGADRARVPTMAAADRATLTELVAGFWVAERAVAAELEPFVAVASHAVPAAATPVSSAATCFALQAGDERRHARFFDRVAGEVLGLGREAVRAAATVSVRTLFEDELGRIARALAVDHSRMAEAVGLYHLVLEGIVFAVGQEALLELCDRDGGLPGVREGTARVQGDERWHVGLGVLQLQRLGGALDSDAVAAQAARAMAAWGPAIATPERIARVRATHARRLRITGTAAAAAVEFSP